jgi:hypothetical protein
MDRKLKNIKCSDILRNTLLYEIGRISEQDTRRDVVLQTGAAVGYLSALVDIGLIDTVEESGYEGLIVKTSEERLEDLRCRALSRKEQAD